MMRERLRTHGTTASQGRNGEQRTARSREKQYMPELRRADTVPVDRARNYNYPSQASATDNPAPWRVPGYHEVRRWPQESRLRRILEWDDGAPLGPRM